MSRTYLMRAAILVGLAFVLGRIAKDTHNLVLVTNSSDVAGAQASHCPPGVAPRSLDRKYRMVVTGGCSGSSFVFKMLRKILAAHGHVVAQEKSEVFKPSKNTMFEEAKALAPAGASERDIVYNATVMLYEETFQRGEVLLSKWTLGFFEEFVDRVGRENVLFGALFRENVLDKVICDIRDCFQTDGFKHKLGFPVFAGNRSRTDSCFARRKAGEGVQTVAHFRPKRLEATVRHLREEARQVAELRERYGAVTYEELTAFEHAADGPAVAASLTAWCVLVARLLWSGIDCGVVETVLRSKVGSRETVYHEDVIDNHEVVFRALREAGLGGYIRSRE